MRYGFYMQGPLFQYPRCTRCINTGVFGQQAWQQWLAHQTMLINENRLSPINPEHRAYPEAEMEKFLFGEGSARPDGYVPPES